MTPKKLGTVILAIIITLTVMITAAYLKVKHGGNYDATNEFPVIKAGVWTEFQTNQQRESIYFNPADDSVYWLVVINKDFQHPTLLKGLAPDYHFGNGVKYIDLSLPPNGRPSADFIIKRVPKW